MEYAVAAVFGLLGIRSLIHWLRRPLESDARRDHVLFALFVVSRAGLWFALMGLFLLYATVERQGRAFSEDAGDFSWYFIVIMVLAALHLVTVFLLGRPPPARPPDEDRAV